MWRCDARGSALFFWGGELIFIQKEARACAALTCVETGRAAQAQPNVHEEPDTPCPGL